MEYNYIVSGLERSGTSLLMQILEAGGFPVVYDDKRKADIHNPKGYYEVEGGKIISSLENGGIDFKQYFGKALKITSYGLVYLPPGNYKVIYIERDLNEIVLSMDKMAESPIDRKEMAEALFKLNENSKYLLDNSKDIKVLYIQHRNLFTNPDTELKKISEFVGGIDIEKAKSVIDQKLYRNRVFKAPYKTKEELTEREEEIIRERLKELGYL